MPETPARQHDSLPKGGTPTDAKTAEAKRQLAAAFAGLKALAEIIRQAGEVPSGVLYARLMSKVTFEDYTRLVETLKRTGLVTETRGHLLRWNEPQADTKGRS